MMQAWTAGPPPREQAYSVACPEGHRLRGIRTEGYQALRCPTCGEGIFVLPRSPLPEPPAPPSAPRDRRAAAAEASLDDGPLPLSDPSPLATSTVGGPPDDEPEVEIDWVDDGPVPEEPARPLAGPISPPRPPPPKPKPKAKPRAARAPAPARPAPVPAAPPVERVRPSEWAWRHRNALLAAGAVVLIAGAILFKSRRDRLEDFPRIAEIGRTEGLRKLDLGEFHAAKKLLGDAADAVDGLGGTYEGADSIRQGAREAAIFTDLVPETLDRLLEEAATYRPAKDWPSRFAAMYRGRSVILDTPVIAVPDPARPGSAYRVEGPIYYGRGPKFDGKARVDLAGFRLFELSEPRVGEQKPFGARLASLEQDPASNEWVLGFEPDSGVFITHPRALEAIGWPPFEAPEEPRP